MPGLPWDEAVGESPCAKTSQTGPLDEVCQMTLSEVAEWVRGVPASLPEEMRPMAESICESFDTAARRLLDLGLGYLTLDRAASTLSTETNVSGCSWPVLSATDDGRPVCS